MLRKIRGGLAAALAVSTAVVSACTTIPAPRQTGVHGNAAAGPCLAYSDQPSATPIHLPPADRVFLVPKRECNISSMAVAIRDEGHFRSVYGPGHEVSPEEASGPVFDRLRDRALIIANENARTGANRPMRILIFAHGGLVSHGNAVAQAQTLAPAMMEDGYEPIFLIWNSDLALAYGDRLCCVRDGERTPRESETLFDVPSRLFGDVLGSAARAPQNFGGQGRRFYGSVIRHEDKYYLGEPDLNFCAKFLQGLSCPTIVLPAGRTDQALNGSRGIGSKEVGYVALAPVRAAETLVAPEVGRAAWDNMVRRTRLAFEEPPPDASSCRPLSPGRDGYTGGFAVFFDQLGCKIYNQETSEMQLTTSDGRSVRVELHFYGHSMGALIGNEALWRHPELPWKRVVYMAAANSIRDFRTMAAPSLARHTDAEFYSLMLHPLNESRELFKGGLAPQGSLLEWIDEMFEGPRNAEERAFGKWSNMKRVLPLLDRTLRTHMHFRVFPKFGALEGPECGVSPNRSSTNDVLSGNPNFHLRCHPVTHGEFDDYSFWRPAYLNGPPS